MLKCFLLLCLSMSLSISAFSQMGDLPITAHSPNLPGRDHSGFEMVFDSHGMMYAANSGGVLRYDGVHWEYIEVPSATFSLAVDHTDRVYVGCSGGFGYLQLSTLGLQYHILKSDSLANQYFTQTRILGDSILFMGQSEIWVYNPANESLNKYESPDRYAMQALVVVEDKVYISTEIASYQWSGNSMKQTDKWVGEDMGPMRIVSTPKEDAYLVLDITGKLYKSTKNGLRALAHLGSDINGVERINNDYFVISTRNRGCKIVRGTDFQVESNIDYSAGLPDNEIKALSVDVSKGVWVAHAFGFSRIDPLAPVKCLSNSGGLKGNLIQSVMYKGKLLVGTSSGVFMSVLDSIYSFQSRQFKITSSRTGVSNAASKAMNFLRKKNQKRDLNTRYITQNEKKFEYARWIYKPLKEIDFKCNDLQIFGNVLLIATNGGLYEFDGKSTRQITTDPVKKIVTISKGKEFLLINGFEGKRFLLEGGIYTGLAFNYEKGLILSAHADDRGLLWVVNPGKVVALGLTLHGASALDEGKMPNSHLEMPSIITIDRALVFVSNSGAYRYNYNKKQLAIDKALSKELGLVLRHFNDNFGNVWIYNGKIWKCLTKDGEFQAYPYLSLYPDIKQIYQDLGTGNLYFITDSNQLNTYEEHRDKNEVYQSSIFYKHLFSQSVYSSFKKKVKLSYDENYLRAELAQPDYLGLLKVEYQYTLEGMDDQWSEWSPDNKIDLNFLPEGSYVLKVRSRDIFDREQLMEPITLVVSPPYWRTTWFYLLEVIFFASLVFISTRLNQTKAQNRFLTEGLTILTIVMIIETLQSVAGSYFSFASSPIIDFAINLCIALIIFPMESFLKYVIRNGEVPIKIKQSKKQES